MNKVRRLAEELVSRYPSLFGGDFGKNKEALSQVSIVRTRSLRNQLAGAITKIMHERTPAEEQGEPGEPATIEERTQSERSNVETAVEEASSQRTSQETKDKESGSVSTSPESGKSESIQENAAVVR